MIIVLKPNVTEQQIEHVVERVESLGLRAHLSRGTYRTIIGVIGDEAKTAGGAASGDPRRGAGGADPAPLQARQPRSRSPSQASSTWRGSRSAVVTWA